MFALEHTGTAKKIQGVFLLCESKSLSNGRHLEAKEIVQSSQIFDSKL
jgi:hypothetical protein